MEKLTALLIAFGIIAIIGIILYLIYRYFLSDELDRKLATLKKQVEISGVNNKKALELAIETMSKENNKKFNFDQKRSFTEIETAFVRKFWSKENACYDPDQCFGRTCMDCEIKK